MEPPRRTRASRARPRASTKPTKAARTLSKKSTADKRPSAKSSATADNAGLFMRSKERVYRHMDREK
jgi:hypothetical protein